MMRCFVLRSKKIRRDLSAPPLYRVLRKAYATTDAQMLSTPWVRTLAAFLHLSLYRERQE
jgi:hypothetical protein